MAHVGRLDRRSILSFLAPVAQLDRASGFYPLGCGFDSCRGRKVQVRDLRSVLPALSDALWARSEAFGTLMETKSALETSPPRTSAVARSRSSVAC